MNNKKQVLKAPQRRNLYISYLKEHGGESSTDDFIDYLKATYHVEISRGTISEDRKYLKKLNYSFEKHGNTFKLAKEPDGTENFSCTNLEEAASHLDRNLFLDWMILKEIADGKTACTSGDFDEDEIFKDALTRLDLITRHLSSLHKQGYLKREGKIPNPYKFSLISDAPCVHCFLPDTLWNFADQHEHLPDTGAAASVLQPVSDFCYKLLNGENSDAEASSSLIHHGRQNIFPTNITSLLQKLNQFNFQQNKLSLRYVSPYEPQPLQFLFSVAVIFYSVETNRCYLLGKSEEYPVMLCRLDRIDFSGTQESDEKNLIYGTSDWKKIYNEIYSSSLDYSSLQNPVKVVVHFSRYSQSISDKIDALVASRPKTAHREDSEDQKTIIYTDTIRGLSSFAHYLRTYGESAHVIAPEELKELMLSSAKKVLARYEEVKHESQN